MGGRAGGRAGGRGGGGRGSELRASLDEALVLALLQVTPAREAQAAPRAVETASRAGPAILCGTAAAGLAGGARGTAGRACLREGGAPHRRPRCQLRAHTRA